VIIILENKPFKEMRYPTLGDWFYEETGALRIVVAKDDEDGVPVPQDEQKLILIHELVEVWLCEKAGITQKQVDDFDLMWEHSLRNTGDEEPGDDPDSPYRTQHRHAMIIEHLLASFMGMDDYGTIR
jgi:hypothetical protein